MQPLTAVEYATLVEQAPILIWRAGVNGQCDYFNDRWLQFRGRRMEQEVGYGWATGIHPEDYERCLETYLSAFKARQAFEVEYRMRRHDGEYRWIFDRGVPFANEAGEFAGYIGSCVDVTEQVELRRRVHELREAELRALRGMLPLCAWCKKVRNDEGYWQAVEVYIRDHADLDFSHGMCPECELRIRAENDV